jgi:RNase P protein component
MTIIERTALLGIGLWLGLAVSRTQFESAALPIYVVVAVLIVTARMAVVRHRARRDMRATSL